MITRSEVQLCVQKVVVYFSSLQNNELLSVKAFISNTFMTLTVQKIFVAAWQQFIEFSSYHPNMAIYDGCGPCLTTFF